MGFTPFKDMHTLLEKGTQRIKNFFKIGKKSLQLSEKQANKLLDLAHLIIEVFEEVEEEVEETVEEVEELLEEE